MPLSRKYSLMAHPEWGAKYCNGAASEAVADTTIVYLIASASVSLFTICATVDLFLPNSAVNAVQFLFWIISIVESLLIDDSINSDSSFTSLTIPNDQLTLTSTNRYKRIYGFDSSLHRFSDRLPWDNAGSLKTDTESLAGSNRSSTINGITQSINYTA